MIIQSKSNCGQKECRNVEKPISKRVQFQVGDIGDWPNAGQHVMPLQNLMQHNAIKKMLHTPSLEECRQ